ncbi:hypothetical protein ACOMHN_051271 [Nucella lapillus]
MEMFSMLKHSIISDNVNPINNHFDIGRQTGSAGPEMVWKIFEAVRKEDKKAKVSEISGIDVECSFHHSWEIKD